MDDAVVQALEVLLRAGWRGVLVALALVLAYVLARRAISALPSVKVDPDVPPDPERGDLPPAALVDSEGRPVTNRSGTELDEPGGG